MVRYSNWFTSKVHIARKKLNVCVLSDLDDLIGNDLKVIEQNFKRILGQIYILSKCVCQMYFQLILSKTPVSVPP